MSTNYPNNVDSYTVHQDGAVEDVTAADVNNLQDAVVAIENQVGTSLSPKLASTGTNTFNGIQTAPAFSVSGLAGATQPSSYVGSTVSGSPVTGTFVVGNWVIDQTGIIWICTVAGTPGTWTYLKPGMQLIADVKLASAQTSITFSNIPQNFKHLKLIVSVAASGSGNVNLQVNGDTTTSYEYGLTTNGTYQSNTGVTSWLMAQTSGTTWGEYETLIADYADATKIHLFSATGASGGNGNTVYSSAGSFVKPAAISSILIFGGTFSVGTRFTLYGMN